MLNKRLFFVLLLVTIIALAGCSMGKKKIVATEEPDQDEIYEKAMDYGEHLQELFDTSNGLLSTFGKSLDGLYTGANSENQFAKMIRENMVEDSRGLVNKANSYGVDPIFFDINQKVTAHISNQHQLFLDALEMINTQRLDKKTLNQTYIRLKEMELIILNEWKGM